MSVRKAISMDCFRILSQKLLELTETGSVRDEIRTVLCGVPFRIRCLDFEPAPKMFSALIRAKDLSSGRREEVFTCIFRDSSELIPILPAELQNRPGRYVWSGDEGRYAFSSEYGFLSLYHAEKNETFVWLCSDKHPEDAFVSPLFRMELGWWALRRDLLFLHSAAVGMDGKGILLSGVGGSGKSTLALSAMLSGMQFLSDDYLIVDPAVPEAFRIYDTGYLTDAMLDRLPELRSSAFWHSDKRNKTLIRLDPEHRHISDRIRLHAVVVPRIVHAATPSLERCADLGRLIPLLASTSYQNRELRNEEVFRSIVRLLRTLPAYDFALTDDLRANASYLKEWTNKL